MRKADAKPNQTANQKQTTRTESGEAEDAPTGEANQKQMTVHDTRTDSGKPKPHPRERGIKGK